MLQISLKQMLACVTVTTVTFWGCFCILAPRPPVEKTVARLIEQAKGQHTYWSSDGNEMTWYYISWHEGYERVYAIDELRYMGSKAKEALPFLQAEMASGIEDIDTGDDVIRLRDAIEKAIVAIDAS